MPICPFAGHRCRRRPGPQRGFTLIELMVALLLIGIILSFAVLSVGDRWGDAVETEARRFAALVGLAGEEALLQSRVIGVRVDPTEYRFLALERDEEGARVWRPLSDQLLRPRRLPEGLELELEMEGMPVTLEPESDSPKPQIVLFSSGERTPFRLDLAPPDGGFRYRVEAPLFGPLEREGPLETW